MGVTVLYRGSIADLSRVEDFEDRVIDLAVAIGGNPRLWRSSDDDDPSRMVRGLLVDLAPGQETTSLLISPEGWLIGIMEIEDAERGALRETPWCWVKTQFGPVEGHVALVELLTGLKKEFFPDLEVIDEGGYWEDRDVSQLRQKIEFLGRGINMLAEALENDGLSSEAREDPDIVATRIERIARTVHATLSRPSEHPPVHFPDDETGMASDPDEHEARHDALFAENRRKQERMMRVMEESTIQGADSEEAFNAAIREVVPEFEWPEESDQGESEATTSDVVPASGELKADTLIEDTEQWRESLSDFELSDDDVAFERMERHPLQQKAHQLLMDCFNLDGRSQDRNPNLDMLIRNGMEITGGLAQTLPLPPPYEMDECEAGLALVQLKRALRGGAFVRGALFLLRGENVVDEEEFRQHIEDADAITTQITDLLRIIRESRS